MKRLLLLTAIFLTACGPSLKEKEEIAEVTCNIMAESRNMDGSMRIRELNAARKKIGADAFLGSDSYIRDSFQNKLCKELVLNDNYEKKLRAKLLADDRARSQTRKNKQDAKEKFRAAVLKKVKDYNPVLTLISSTSSGFVSELGISCTYGLAGNPIYFYLKNGISFDSPVPEDDNCDLAPRILSYFSAYPDDMLPFKFDDIESVEIKAVVFGQSVEDVSNLGLGLDLDQETINILNSNRSARIFDTIPIKVSINDN